jgi:hypothetical protein
MAHADGERARQTAADGLTHQTELPCPCCGMRLFLEDGSWPYRYTQVLLHLDRCAPYLTSDERHEAAQTLRDDL